MAVKDLPKLEQIVSNYKIKTVKSIGYVVSEISRDEVLADNFGYLSGIRDEFLKIGREKSAPRIIKLGKDLGGNFIWALRGGIPDLVIFRHLLADQSINND